MAPRMQIADCFDCSESKWVLKNKSEATQQKVHQKNVSESASSESQQRTSKSLFSFNCITDSLTPSHCYLPSFLSFNKPSFSESDCFLKTCFALISGPVCVTADPRIGSSPQTPAMPNEISSPPDPRPDEKCVPRTFSLLHKLNVKCFFFLNEMLSPVLDQCGE